MDATEPTRRRFPTMTALLVATIVAGAVAFAGRGRHVDILVPGDTFFIIPWAAIALLGWAVAVFAALIIGLVDRWVRHRNDS